MDHQGERRNPIIVLTPEELESLVRAFWKGQSLESIDLLLGGLSNTNDRLKITGVREHFVLRLFPDKEKRSKTELTVLKQYGLDLSGPSVLGYDFTRQIVPYSFAIFQWIEGEPLSQVLKLLRGKELNELGIELGEALCSIHKIKFPQMGLFDEFLNIELPFQDPYAFLFPFVEERLGRGKARERLGVDLSDRILKLLCDHKNMIQEIEDYSSLTHGDFNAKNLIVKKATEGYELAAVIDWEFALSCSPLFDLGNLLRYDADFSEEFQKGIVLGFQESGGTLPLFWKRASKLLDLINLCDFLDAKKEKPILFADSKRLIQDTLLVGSCFKAPQGLFHRFEPNKSAYRNKKGRESFALPGLFLFYYGGPDRARTCDLQIRSLTL